MQRDFDFARRVRFDDDDEDVHDDAYAHDDDEDEYSDAEAPDNEGRADGGYFDAEHGAVVPFASDAMDTAKRTQQLDARERLAHQAAAEDEGFKKRANAVLAGAPADVVSKRTLPVQAVADILNKESDEERDAALSAHADIVERVTALLESYIDDHYESFNSSIEYFSEMIMRVSAAQDAVSDVRHRISASAELMESCAPELRNLRHRVARCIAREGVITQVRKCAIADARSAALLAEQNAYAAVVVLRRYVARSAKLADDGLELLRPLSTILAQRLRSVAPTVGWLLRDCVFSDSDAERLHAKLDAPRALYTVPSAASVRAFARQSSRSGDVMDGCSLTAMTIAAHVAALHHMDDLSAARALLFETTSREFTSWTGTFIKSFVAWLRSTAFHGAPAAPLPSTASHGDGDTARAQRPLLARFFEMLLCGLWRIFRRACHVALCAACIETPFLRVLLLADAGVLSDSAKWPVGEASLPMRTVATVVAQALDDATRAVNARGADHQLAVQKLAGAADPSKWAGDAATLDDALKKLGDAKAFVGAAHSSSVQPEALASCHRTASDAVRKRFLAALEAIVGDTLKRWDVQSFWNAVQGQVQLLVEHITNTSATSTARTNMNHQRAAGSSNKMSQPKAVTVSFDSLSTLLSQRGSLGMPRFLEELGTIDAVDIEHSARELGAREQEAARGNSTARPDLAVQLLEPLAHLVHRTPLNATPIVGAVARFVGFVHDACPFLPASDRDALPVCIQRASTVFASSIRTATAERLANMYATAGVHPLDCGYHVTSPQPLLKVCLEVSSAIDHVRDLREAAVVARAPTLAAVDALVETLGLQLKHRLRVIAAGSFALGAIDPMLDEAYSHMPSPGWRSLCDGNGSRTTQQTLDSKVADAYSALHKSRASGTRTSSDNADATGVRIVEPSASDAVPLASQEARAELAALCHSAEWLASRYTAFVTSDVGTDTSDQPVPCTGPDVAKFVSHHGAAGVAVYQQLAAVSQAALFMLAVDAKLGCCTHMVDMRDVSYNLNATSSHASAFVERFANRSRSGFAGLAEHLAPAKRRYIASGVATPASDLFLFEVSHLRDKRITRAGSKQLMTDVNAVQHTIVALCPTDASLAEQVDDAMRRPREYFALLSAGSAVVRNIVSARMYERYSQVELENLVSLTRRGIADDNAVFDSVAHLQRAVAAATEAIDARPDRPAISASLAALYKAVDVKAVSQQAPVPAATPARKAPAAPATKSTPAPAAPSPAPPATPATPATPAPAARADSRSPSAPPPASPPPPPSGRSESLAMSPASQRTQVFDGQSPAHSPKPPPGHGGDDEECEEEEDEYTYVDEEYEEEEEGDDVR